MSLASCPSKLAALFASLGLFILPIFASETAETPSNAPTAAQPAGAVTRLGINLGGVSDWNTELPFVDVFKTARRWVSQKQGEAFGKGPELALDEKGWVRQLEPGCFAQTTVFTDNREGRYPAGIYTLLYDGEGKLEILKGPKELTREPGRITFDVDPPRDRGIWITLSETNPENYVRNIRFLMPGYEENYAEEIFQPDFLKRWEGMESYRFMDWQRTNGSPLVKWEERPQVDDAVWTSKGGVPLEIMIELANRQNIAPWFCLPHGADDEFIREFATMVQAKLNPELPVYIEYSNEVWNNMFAQHQYAAEKGKALGFSEKPWEAAWLYTARRSVEMFEIWGEAFGDSERLVRLLPSQAGNAYVAGRILRFEDAGRHADALTIAPYLSFGIPEESDKGRPTANEVAQWTPQQVVSYMQTEVLPQSIQKIRENKAVADEYGLLLIAYEAGQHAVGLRGAVNNDKLTEVLKAANRHPDMGKLYTEYLDAWKENGGDLMALFSSVGLWTKWGSWGLMEYYDQTDEEMPKMGAVRAWMKENQPAAE